MPRLDRFLRWSTAALCGYEAHAIVAKALHPEYPLPTITKVTHAHRAKRATYVVVGGIIGLLFHHLLIEGLDTGS